VAKGTRNRLQSDATSECGSDAARGWATLQAFVVAAGLLASLVFIVAGLTWDLQLYGDGAIFAYGVAVQDSWAIHWHNIIARATVYLATCLPAETYVALTGNARGGITLYSLLFFSAQLVGLVATFMADRSAGRLLFTFACLSTAILCPLVFGFPTEMWFAHALFWPALALTHYAPPTLGSFLKIVAVLTALVHAHGGGVVFTAVVALTAALRQPAHAFIRASGASAIAMVIWLAANAAVQPDDRITPIMMRAALNFIDPRTLLTPVMGLLLFAVVGYAGLLLALRRTEVRNRTALACGIVAGLLAVYWGTLDHNLLAEDRYFLRTALFFLTPPLGLVALLSALQQEGRLTPVLAFLPSAERLLSYPTAPKSLAGGLILVILVHTVEAAKFIDGWTRYEGFVRTLAMGQADGARAEGATGEDRFVSADRVPADLGEFSWSSTTQYLSVVAAPGLDPARLVINSDEGYQWITCRLAKRQADEHRAVPRRARKLVEAHACALP
jgi:hypothetical protein